MNARTWASTVSVLLALGATSGCLGLTDGTEQVGGGVGEGRGGGDDECLESCDYDGFPEIATTCDEDGVRHEQECTGARTCAFGDLGFPHCVSCEEVGEVACEDGNGCCGSGGDRGGAAEDDVPAAWTCVPVFWGDGSCDCGCGAADPDCDRADACDFCWDDGGQVDCETEGSDSGSGDEDCACDTSWGCDDCWCEPAGECASGDEEPADSDCDDWCILDDGWCDDDTECGGDLCEGDCY